MILKTGKRSRVSRRRHASGGGEDLWHLSVSVNGKREYARTPPTQTLLDFLRLELGLTGTKGACLEGECGSCYVLVDGRPVHSCLVLVAQVQNRAILTIEGMAHGEELDVIQQKFIECGAVQCGYCTPGLIMAAKALLMKNPDPGRDDILTAIEGNLCRCTGYNTILRAVQEAANELGLRK